MSTTSSSPPRRREHKAFVLWEPFVSKALQERPEARVLVDSSQFKGYIVDVLVAQQKWLRDHPAEARVVVQSYLEVLHARQQSADGMAPAGPVRLRGQAE